MKTLRTAVVGLGRIGWQFHAPQIVEHEGFELVAVVDPLAERLDEAKARWSVKGYTHLEAMLGAEKLDLVVIAAPTLFHADQTVAAFGAGCDVFCDKPMAASLAEADRMVRAMTEHGRRLMVYQPHRASAEMVALQAILAQGLLGEVYLIKRSTNRYARRNDWQAFRSRAGGMLNNYGAHYIDQCLFLAGSPARRITCAMRAEVTLGDADDVVKALIETESGLLLDLDINMAAALPIAPWQVFGKCGAATLDNEAKVWRVRFVRAEDLPATPLHSNLAAEARRYGSGEVIPWQERAFPLADFPPVDFYAKCYEYYALGKEPFVPIAQTREVMRVLAACREDAGWATETSVS